MKGIAKRFNHQIGKLRVRFDAPTIMIDNALETPGDAFQVQFSLPPELWLLVCDNLGPSDRKSLAQTSQLLWMLINSKAPFLSQIIQEDAILNLTPQLLAQRLYFLTSAVEVCWLGAGGEQSFLASAVKVHWLGAGREHFLSSNPLTAEEQSPALFLCTLSESTVLQSLELSQVKVSPHWQQVILQIPTLRKLTLFDAPFVPTTVNPPAFIRTLVLRSFIFEQTTMRHLFQLVANSLETLEIGTDCSEAEVHNLYSMLLKSAPLRRFASIRTAMPVLWSNLNHPFFFHAFITVLHVNPTRDFPLSAFPTTFLPRLRHLSSPWCVAKLMVPIRPVQVFCDTERQVLTLSNFESMLVPLARSASDIEELELCSGSTSFAVFDLLKKYLPRLKRLRLLVHKSIDPWSAITVDPWVATGYKPMKVNSQFTALQELEFRVEIPLKTRQPHQVSRPYCRKLSTLFIPMCPALEVLSVIVVPHNSKANERDIPPRRIFRLRRLANGEWEERGFGIEVPEDARGFPVADFRYS